MSFASDSRRCKSASPRGEPVDFMTTRRLARPLQRVSTQMRRPVLLSVTIAAMILGAALLLNGVVYGAALFLPVLALSLRRPPRAPDDDRSAVRLALRLARAGEKTLLVESGSHVRVARIGEERAGLQYVGALANGALILARRR
jgi:hypothetical protein